MNRLIGGLVLVGLLIALGAADSAGAAQPPYINSGFADRPVEPTHFSPDHPVLTYTTVNNYVRDVKWSSWGGKEAVGSGQVSLLHGEEGTEMATWLPEETSPVSVRLGGLHDCLGVEVYTTYSLSLASGAEAPMGWPRGRHGTFPCRVESGGYWDGAKLAHEKYCEYRGLQQERVAPGNGDHVTVVLHWTPRTPGDQGLVFCHMRVEHWGAPVATVIGSATGQLARPHVHPALQDVIWPARLEFRDPAWCPGAAGDPWFSSSDPGVGGAAPVTYGAIRLTLYGNGRTMEWVNGKPDIGWRTVPNGKPRVFLQRLKTGPSQCLLGIEMPNPVYVPERHR